MKIFNYISAFALATLMCCCAGSDKEVSAPKEVSVDTVASVAFVPVEDQITECYVDKLSYAICIDCDVLDQFRTFSVYGPEKKMEEKMPVVVFVEGEVKDMPSFEWARTFVDLGYKVCIPKCSNIKADRNNDNTMKTFRTSLSDVNDALKTMKTKADKYGIDTTNIFLAGNASGAYLVASYMYTYVSGTEKLTTDGIKGVISISTSAALNLNELEKNFDAKTPCLIFHGTADKYGAEGLLQSKQLSSQLGDLAQFTEVDGANEFPTPEYTKVVKDKCREFLKKHTSK
ncbi:MAG: hypothetical protein KBT22_09650 [Bacteroidales bacterium]|nr:hypothetical protein [Candidatus Scybalocola fimicaballi]